MAAALDLPTYTPAHEVIDAAAELARALSRGGDGGVGAKTGGSGSGSRVLKGAVESPSASASASSGAKELVENAQQLGDSIQRFR